MLSRKRPRIKETEPRKPRQKRNKLSLDDGSDPKDFVAITRTVKCALGSVLLANDSVTQFKSFLNQTVLYVSQLRFLASCVIKHHMFTTGIVVEINQNYLSDTFALLRRKPIKSSLYSDSLITSMQFVTDTIAPTMVEQCFSDTAMSNIVQYSARTMLVNIQVHVQERLVQAFQTWVNNQIRALMTPDERERFRTNASKYKKRIETLPFYDVYQQYQSRVNALVPEDPPEDHKMNTQAGMKLMYEMKTDSELLETRSGVKMKGICVIPQNSLSIADIRIDSYSMAAIYKQLIPDCTLSIDKLKSIEYQDTTWSGLFDLETIQRLRRSNKLNVQQWKFQYSLQTDGIHAAIGFTKYVRKYKPSAKRSLDDLTAGLYYETPLMKELKQPDEFPHHIDFVSIDPGIRSIITSWNHTSGEVDVSLSQKHYKHFSGMNDHNAVQTRIYSERMSDVKSQLDSAPYRNYVSIDKMTLYLKAIGSVWTKSWKFYSSHNFRFRKFKAWQNRQRFIDKFLSKICAVNDRPKIVLFGNGCEGGRFNKLKSGGFKGPVLKLRSLISKRLPVISVSEFRTSKHCLCCGRNAKHPLSGSMHGVSYCPDTEHCRMLNRDVDAAQKIGYRFLARLMGMEIGPWNNAVEAFGDEVTIVPGGTALRDFATKYFDINSNGSDVEMVDRSS